MSILRPYVNWMRTLTDLTSSGDNKDDRFALCPLYDVDPCFLHEQPDAIKIRKRLVQTLEWDLTVLHQAKRFVFPLEFDPMGYDQPDDNSMSKLYEANPNLPFPFMYIQVHHDSIFPRGRPGEDSQSPLRYEDESFYDTSYNEETEENVSQPKFWTFGVEQNELGWGVRMGCERRFTDTRKITFDFLPAAMAYGMVDDKGKNSMGYGCYEGFVHKHPEEEIAGLYMTMMYTVMRCVDLINHYPVEIRKSPGLNQIRHLDKVKIHTKLSHSIIKLGQPYYERIDHEIEERDKIHHREHDVRGHWRTLRNGRMVWVKSHKRGDPALGRVESEYDV